MLRDDTTQLLSNAQSVLETGLGQQHGKLFTAQTRSDVARSNVAAKDRAKLSKHRIARKVPVLIVDRLELIRVEHTERQWPSKAA